ncbi:Lga2 protein [Sporisorium reilianum SRZ2]|uniref:Lga2 protein n=2 Tax=Sporisorium reilianum TaxID=72558 RepID=E6ZV67_SPORE|nr:lga2 protein [Sporisorium reilianum]CBQ71124.1 Lga2 protein [Sporisorium reilianum SRZ2]
MSSLMKVRPLLSWGLGARPRLGSMIRFQAPRLTAGIRNLAGRKQWISRSKVGPITRFFLMSPAGKNGSGFRLRTRFRMKGAMLSMDRRVAFGWYGLERDGARIFYAQTESNEFPNITSKKLRIQGQITSQEVFRRYENHEAIPKSALSPRRVEIMFQVYHKIKIADGLFVIAHRVVTPKENYVEINAYSPELDANGQLKKLATMCVYIQDEVEVLSLQTRKMGVSTP